MNAFPRDPSLSFSRSTHDIGATPGPACEGDDREILFTILAPCLGCMEAAEALEALFDRFDSLAEVMAAAPCDLAAVPELGEAGAAVLMALQAAAAQLERQRSGGRPVLVHPASWIAHLRRGGAGIAPGEFRALFLDRGGVLLAEETVSVNGSASVPGRVIRRAMALEAEGFVLARGHEGGTLAPSESDIVMACSLQQAARVLGLRLHDHLVMARGAHASLRDAGVV